jgi:hypothetical protein
MLIRTIIHTDFHEKQQQLEAKTERWIHVLKTF